MKTTGNKSEQTTRNAEIPLTTLYRYLLKDKKDLEKKCDILKGENDSLADENTYLSNLLRKMKQNTQARHDNGEFVTYKEYESVITENKRLRTDLARIRKTNSINVTRLIELNKKNNNAVSVAAE